MGKREVKVFFPVQYYTERLSVYFNLEIQSNHFGNGRLLAVEEGFSIELVDTNYKPQSEFYSHFLDMMHRQLMHI